MTAKKKGATKTKTPRQQTPFGFTRLRRVGGETSSLVLTVPAATARQLEHLLGRLFSVELTEAGILFRPLPAGQEPQLEPPAPPEWVNGSHLKG